jgi:L-rhamnose isomerase
MLRRLLSIASALSLARLVAASDPFDHDDSSIASLSAIEPYTLNLSCAECAFSYSECSENVHPNSYLVRSKIITHMIYSILTSTVNHLLHKQ